MADLAPIAGKLAPLIRLLASDKSGEVSAAVCAIARILKTAGADFHDLAKHIETNGGLNKAEMAKLYRAGFADGVRETENSIHGANGFQSVGQPSFNEMAEYVQKRIYKLDEKHHVFIDEMASLTLYREPSPKQAKYLKSLFAQCGGGR